MHEHESAISPLSSIEISGAISARVIHDLANLVSGIIGNAEYAQQAETDPENLKKSLRAIGLSAQNAGKLLGQCLPLQKLLAREAIRYDAAESAAAIAEAAGLAPGWRVNEPPPLPGQVFVQPRWLISAVWQIARETEAYGGEVDFSCGPAIPPVVWTGANPNASQTIQLFQITLRYRADQPLFANATPANLDRYGLLAAQELIRRLKGQIHARPKPPGRQEISILLPLI